MVAYRPHIATAAVPELPIPGEYEDSSDFAEALADGLRHAPLGGTKERPTKEVRDWAESLGLDPESPELLERYNEAATRAPQDLESKLRELAEEELGRKALISLLAVTGASDQLRSPKPG